MVGINGRQPDAHAAHIYSNEQNELLYNVGHTPPSTTTFMAMLVEEPQSRGVLHGIDARPKQAGGQLATLPWLASRHRAMHSLRFLGKACPTLVVTPQGMIFLF